MHALFPIFWMLTAVARSVFAAIEEFMHALDQRLTSIKDASAQMQRPFCAVSGLQVGSVVVGRIGVIVLITQSSVLFFQSLLTVMEASWMPGFQPIQKQTEQDTPLLGVYKTQTQNPRLPLCDRIVSLQGLSKIFFWHVRRGRR